VLQLTRDVVIRQHQTINISAAYAVISIPYFQTLPTEYTLIQAECCSA
jgi:hypothetical protein